LGIHSLDVGV